MTKELKLLQVSIQESEKSTEYSTTQTAIDSLQTLNVKYGLPILDMLKIINKKLADSVSVGKDDPHVYFFAKRNRNSVSFRINEGKRAIRFELPLENGQLETLRLQLA
ncbi:MAG: hypothetical protein ABSD41_09255 [Candidatus Bathyarchaeia archaeon]|jgi:hypothetical protein